MSHQKKDHPTSADKFAEAAEPSLRTVLTHQVDLIQSGELKTINRTEWDRGIEETKRMFEKSRQITRKM